MITIYHAALSPYARKVKIALDYKEVPYTAVTEGLFVGDGAGAQLRQRSRRAEVPILEDGELTIWDSTVICEYLEEAYPTRPLLPHKPGDRARCRLLEDRCDTTFDSAMYGLYAGMVLAKDAPRAQEMVAAGTREVQALLREFEAELGGADFLCGGNFTLSDIALFTHVSGAVGLGISLDGVDRISQWLARMMEVTCIQKDMEAAQAAMVGALGQGDSPGRHQWRSDRLEFPFRHGLAEFLLEQIRKGRVYFPPNPGA